MDTSIPTADSHLEDVAWLVRARDHGDHEAFARFLERHGPAAWRLCRRQCRSDSDADDCFQQAALRALEGLHTFDPERGRPLSWFLTVAVNACRMHHRSHSRRVQRHQRSAENPPMPPPTPDQILDDADLHDLVRREIEGLPEHERLPLWLHAAEGLSFGEIASVLARSENTVRSQARRGLQRLRGILDRRGLGAAGLALLAIPWTWAAGEGGHPLVASIAECIARGELAASPSLTTSSASALPLIATIAGSLAFAAAVTLAVIPASTADSERTVPAQTAAVSAPTAAIDAGGAPSPEVTLKPQRPQDFIAFHLVAGQDGEGATLDGTEVRDPPVIATAAGADPSFRVGRPDLSIGVRLAAAERLAIAELPASVRLSGTLRALSPVPDPQRSPVVSFLIPERRVARQPWPRRVVLDDDAVRERALGKLAAGDELAFVAELAVIEDGRSLRYRVHLDGSAYLEAIFDLGPDRLNPTQVPFVSTVALALFGFEAEVSGLVLAAEGCRLSAEAPDQRF